MTTTPAAGSSKRLLLAQNVRPLGKEFSDWHLRQFEVCPVTCELRYISNRKHSDLGRESKHAPGFKSIGFIQSSTEVKALHVIELVDQSSQKVSLWPFEVSFFNVQETMVGERTVVIGCESIAEQLSWITYIEKLIADKDRMSTDRYLEWCDSRRSKREEQSLEIFNAMRKDGSLINKTCVNEDEYRKARIKNGKVFLDAIKYFQQYASVSAGHSILDVDYLVPIMHQLGLDIKPEQLDMLLDDILNQRDAHADTLPSEVDLDGHVSQAEFQLIVKT